MSSEDLEAFLSLLRDAQKEREQAVADEQWCNDATQDILHAVELEDVGKRRPAKTMKALREIRRRRRRAKNTMERLEPIVDWMGANGAAVKAMERCLGEMRKAERRQTNRAYQPRTDILEDTNGMV